MYIDLDTLVRKGNTVQAWDWQKFATGQTSVTWQGTFFWVKSLTSYHCMQRTTDAVLKVYFGKDGVEIKREHLEGLQYPAAVEPDSLQEKMLAMACNPPKPALKRAAVAAKPAKDAGAASETDLLKSDSGAAKGDPAKADSKPGKAEETDETVAKAKSADPVAPRKKSSRTMNAAARQPYPSTVRMESRKKLPAAVRLAKAKPQADLKCPPPEQAVASRPVQPMTPAPQLTDAGNDGMFN